jgi:hypothetical protein
LVGWYRWAWLTARIGEAVEQLAASLGWLSHSTDGAPRAASHFQGGAE